MPAALPHIAHIIYRLDVGGLENGLVNLINRTPQLRHSIICLTDYSSFRERIVREGVEVIALNKKPGKDLAMYGRALRVLRALKPDVVHTRNLATVDCQALAALVGVKCRLHGEHGRDLDDLDGSNRKNVRLRRMFRPFIHHYIALSRDLERYLQESIGVDPGRISQIYNGVDHIKFHPALTGREALAQGGFNDANSFVIGTVGRMQGVKDQLNLVRAFIDLLDLVPNGRSVCRLAIVGDGPLREQALELLRAARASDYAWLPGESNDVAAIMRGFDLFVLPSLAEGISNTILEAMASGLPVLATNVGGNPELVVGGKTGELVASGDPAAMARALAGYLSQRQKGKTQGRHARERILQLFSMDAMVNRYLATYQMLLRRNGLEIVRPLPLTNS